MEEQHDARGYIIQNRGKGASTELGQSKHPTPFELAYSRTRVLTVIDNVATDIVSYDLGWRTALAEMHQDSCNYNHSLPPNLTKKTFHYNTET